MVPLLARVLNEALVDRGRPAMLGTLFATLGARMGFRFRKTFKLLPGIRLNLSRRGVTASIGKPGATLNVGGKGGPRATVGIPGTGMSYTERLAEPAEHASAPPAPQPAGVSLWRLVGWGVVALLVFKVGRWLVA